MFSNKASFTQGLNCLYRKSGNFLCHGATTEQTMAHIAVWQFVDGSGGEFGPLVTDAEYLGE